ncbi:MAG TPA: SGNH/GDSL hydrolase family protein [Gaiellaceae bacterium]|nr:SGNH/GDSL hydrolase family protein [Gaiellaceae bacterium]
MRSRTPLLLVLLALVTAGCVQAPRGDGHEPLRVLFVGNSLTHTNDLPAVVATLARGLGTEIEYETIAPGGMSLEDHWNAGRVPTEIATGRWDAVVMQQGPSALPESQANLREWAGRLAELAREHGARPALLTVWPERYRVSALGEVIVSYANAAKAARAELYPAGVAWQAAWSRTPSLPLYGPDGFHPSALGTYLAALVVTAGLTGRQPPAAAFSTDGPGFKLTVSGARARLLQTAALAALAAAR